MIKVLFVCLGNICRSPLAEAIFKDKIRYHNLDKLVTCDSAGTANYHVGDLPDSRTRKVAKTHSIPIDHRGRQFSKNDGELFDYLLAMDQSNFRNMVYAMENEPTNLLLMRRFDPEARDTDVPDPYYGPGDGFEEMYQILDRSLDEFILFLKKEHNLP